MPTPEQSTSRVKLVLLSLVPAWFIVALGLSLAGCISKVHPAVLLIGGFILPALAFWVSYRLSADFRTLVLSQSLKRMTLLQASRLTGVVFFAYYHQGKLPAEFAVSTGISDVSIGISAPLVASAITSRTRMPSAGFLWHLAGMLGLMISGIMGVLTSPAPIGILASEITSQAMSDFPLNLVPLFLGPLILIFHLAAFCILLQKPLGGEISRHRGGCF